MKIAICKNTPLWTLHAVCSAGHVRSPACVDGSCCWQHQRPRAVLFMCRRSAGRRCAGSWCVQVCEGVPHVSPPCADPRSQWLPAGPVLEGLVKQED
jgi:hypothetical protein